MTASVTAVGAGDLTADTEPGSQPGVGVTVPQVGQDQRRLLARIEPPPAAADCMTVCAQQLGKVGQGAGGQRDTGGIGQQAKLPGQAVVLGRPMSYRELRPMWTSDTPAPSRNNGIYQNGNGSVHLVVGADIPLAELAPTPQRRHVPIVVGGVSTFAVTSGCKAWAPSPPGWLGTGLTAADHGHVSHDARRQIRRHEQSKR